MNASHLDCEIAAASNEAAAELQRIAQVCAKDVGVEMTFSRGPRRKRSMPPVFTLKMSASLAASQHPVWCLACRLACFCPQARVSVLVQSLAAAGLLAQPVRETESAA
jgi:hypothetical protein